MAYDIDQRLAKFGDKAWSARLVRGVCTAAPVAPALRSVSSIDDLVRQLDANAPASTAALAATHAASESALGALWMADLLDAADGGLAVVTGVSSAVKAYKSGVGSLSNDSPQAADAVVKALGIAYIAWRLFDGTASERARALLDTETGKTIITYYAAVEVGLPFADNVMRQGGKFLETLFDRWGAEEADKLGNVAGEEAAQESLGVLDALLDPVEKVIGESAQHLSTVSLAVSENLPKALDVADKVAGVMATGADVYKFLGARLVAEVAVRRALAEVDRSEPPPPPVAGKLEFKEPVARPDPLPPLPEPPPTSPPANEGLRFEQRESTSAAPILLLAAIVVVAVLGGGVAVILLDTAQDSSDGSDASTERTVDAPPPSDDRDAGKPGKSAGPDRSGGGKAGKSGGKAGKGR